jgi:hypothetical protein
MRSPTWNKATPRPRWSPRWRKASPSSAPCPPQLPQQPRRELLTTPLSQDLGDEDDHCAPDREQQLVDSLGDQPASWQRLGGRLHGQHQDRPAKDHPGDQSCPCMRCYAYPRPPADPPERRAQEGVLGGLEQQHPHRGGAACNSRGAQRFGDALLDAVGGVNAKGAASSPVTPSTGRRPLEATRPTATPAQTSTDQLTFLHVSASSGRRPANVPNPAATSNRAS